MQKEITIKKKLEQIGLTGKKADVYLACLKFGKSTAYFISQKTGLKRPTVYDIVEQLQKDGFVYKTTKDNITYYLPSDPKIFLEKIQEKGKYIEEIMPTLQDVYLSPFSIQPTVKYYQGSESVKKALDNELNKLKKGDEILGYLGEGIVAKLPDYTKDFVNRRAKKGVRMRAIMKKHKALDEYLNKNDEQLRRTRVLEEKDFPIKNEVNIFKNKVFMFSFGESEIFGTIIESKEIADSQRALFELAWRGAKDICINSDKN